MKLFYHRPEMLIALAIVLIWVVIGAYLYSVLGCKNLKTIKTDGMVCVGSSSMMTCSPAYSYICLDK